MTLIDEVRIFIKAGNGGNGSASLSKEKYNPNAGPDGGNGGKGGDVIIQANSNLSDLNELALTRKYFAQNGQSGQKKNMHGKKGEKIIIKVPVGSQVFDKEGETEVIDLTQDKQEFTLAYGGKGGAGNTCFKSSTNRTPTSSKPGEEGESGYIYIKLKTISDVGLLGLPNAGKSSFLNKVANVKQKAASYKFTTIEPKLGYVPMNYYDGFLMADIPGLIEDASEGKGLGHKFLKHIERCKTLIHLIDATSDNIAEDYFQIRKELKKFDAAIAQKREFIAITKIDLLDEEIVDDIMQTLKSKIKQKIYPISSSSNQGIEELKKDVFDFILQERKKLKEQNS